MYDYRDIAGPPALLPNYALGPQYSRWFSYADWEEREIVATFARNSIPLSVMQVGGGGCGTQGTASSVWEHRWGASRSQRRCNRRCSRVLPRFQPPAGTPLLHPRLSLKVDMDWHDSYPRGVPSVPPALTLPRELEPWTGFTIWEDMYPAVADMQVRIVGVSERRHAGSRTRW